MSINSRRETVTRWGEQLPDGVDQATALQTYPMPPAKRIADLTAHDAEDVAALKQAMGSAMQRRPDIIVFPVGTPAELLHEAEMTGHEALVGQVVRPASI